MEDVSFCLRAREKGFKVHVDPKVVVGHEKKVIF
jgi:GT2 family glycosyltransferase